MALPAQHLSTQIAFLHRVEASAFFSAFVGIDDANSQANVLFVTQVCRQWLIFQLNMM